MAAPDVVYLVRPGDLNDELRWSLRSLANLPHRRVWIAGFQPSWTCNVGRIKVPQTLGKWDNQQRTIRAVCDVAEVSERFVLFNDDFFVVEPLARLPVLHRGTLGAFSDRSAARGDEYGRRIRATLKYLGPDALSYDGLHVPMTFNRRRLAPIIDKSPPGVLFRSVYGNKAAVGGREHSDVKVSRNTSRYPSPFVSTSDGAFKRRPVGEWIRGMFPEPSPYER